MRRYSKPNFWTVLLWVLLAIVFVAMIVSVVALILSGVHGVGFVEELQSWFNISQAVAEPVTNTASLLM